MEGWNSFSEIESTTSLWNELNLGDLLKDTGVINQALIGVPSEEIERALSPKVKSVAKKKHMKMIAKPGFAVLMDRYHSQPSNPVSLAVDAIDRLADPIRGKFSHYDELKREVEEEKKEEFADNVGSPIHASIHGSPTSKGNSPTKSFRRPEAHPRPIAQRVVPHALHVNSSSPIRIHQNDDPLDSFFLTATGDAESELESDQEDRHRSELLARVQKALSPIREHGTVPVEHVPSKSNINKGKPINQKKLKKLPTAANSLKERNRRALEKLKKKNGGKLHPVVPQKPRKAWNDTVIDFARRDVNPEKSGGIVPIKVGRARNTAKPSKSQKDALNPNGLRLAPVVPLARGAAGARVKVAVAGKTTEEAGKLRSQNRLSALAKKLQREEHLLHDREARDGKDEVHDLENDVLPKLSGSGRGRVGNRPIGTASEQWAHARVPPGGVVSKRSNLAGGKRLDPINRNNLGPQTADDAVEAERRGHGVRSAPNLLRGLERVDREYASRSSGVNNMNNNNNNDANQSRLRRKPDDVGGKSALPPIRESSSTGKLHRKKDADVASSNGRNVDNSAVAARNEPPSVTENINSTQFPGCRSEGIEAGRSESDPNDLYQLPPSVLAAARTSSKIRSILDNKKKNDVAAFASPDKRTQKQQPRAQNGPDPDSSPNESVEIFKRSNNPIISPTTASDQAVVSTATAAVGSFRPNIAEHITLLEEYTAKSAAAAAAARAAAEASLPPCTVNSATEEPEASRLMQRPVLLRTASGKNVSQKAYTEVVNAAHNANLKAAARLLVFAKRMESKFAAVDDQVAKFHAISEEDAAD